jgi:hypothetical protein
MSENRLATISSYSDIVEYRIPVTHQKPKGVFTIMWAKMLWIWTSDRSNPTIIKHDYHSF